MREFNPAKPAVLRDRTNNSIYTWTGEFEEDFRRTAIHRGDGTVEWRGCMFDGWDDVLGG
jgi:hypothetical protein